MAFRLLCKNCGYNHERRDFIRATLLHLIDGLEINRQFIEFIRNEGIIDETRRKELLVVSEKETSRPHEMAEKSLPEVTSLNDHTSIKAIRKQGQSSS